MPVLVAQLIVLIATPFCIATVLLGLPGTWLAIGIAALCDYFSDGVLFHWGTFAAAIGLAVLGEIWELVASATRARQAGASRTGTLSAFVGGFVGAIVGTLTIPIPLIGTLAGGGIGAFLAATLVEQGKGKNAMEATRIGKAAGVGHVLGLLGKFMIGGSVWILLSVAVFVS